MTKSGEMGWDEREKEFEVATEPRRLQPETRYLGLTNLEADPRIASNLSNDNWKGYSGEKDDRRQRSASSFDEQTRRKCLDSDSLPVGSEEIEQKCDS